MKDGYNVALNDLSFLAKQKKCPHFTTVCKITLNQYLRPPVLSLNSILAVPHFSKQKSDK